MALHRSLVAASVPADEMLYQRQTWGEPAEPSRSPTGRSTRWSLRASCTGWRRRRLA